MPGTGIMRRDLLKAAGLSLFPAAAEAVAPPSLAVISGEPAAATRKALEMLGGRGPAAAAPVPSASGGRPLRPGRRRGPRGARAAPARLPATADRPGARRDRVDTRMRMLARYPGRCCACGGPIEVGAEIEWDTAGRRGRHAGCPAPVERPGVPAVVPTEWFRARWKQAERRTPEALRHIAWTVAINARKESREIVDCGTALLAAPDLYLVHGGYAPVYVFTHAVLRGGSAAYLAALSAAIPDDAWPLEGELCAGGYCLWRTYPSCLLTGPRFNGTLEYL